MLPKNIPEDINVELLLSYFPEGSCKVQFQGMHKRNSYCDIVEAYEQSDGTMLFAIGRNSLYNALPEYMFHPVDRFDHLPEREKKDRIAEEVRRQEQEKEHAYRFFAPLDLLLLHLRVEIRKKVEAMTADDKVLTDIICNNLTPQQQANRFVGRALKFIPCCKSIRGDKTLITFMLRKIFMDEGMKVERRRRIIAYTDDSPRYDDGLDSDVGEGYVGNMFDEETTVYEVHYWSDEECNAHFLDFIDELETFRAFVQDYFFAVGDCLRFVICKDDAPLRLSDETIFNYMNYNTNL